MPVLLLASGYASPPPFGGPYLGTLVAAVARRNGVTHLLHTHLHLQPPKSQLFWLPAAGPPGLLYPSPGEVGIQAEPLVQTLPPWGPPTAPAHGLKVTFDLLLARGVTRIDASKTLPAFLLPRGSGVGPLQCRGLLAPCRGGRGCFWFMGDKFQNIPRQLPKDKRAGARPAGRTQKSVCVCPVDTWVFVYLCVSGEFFSIPLHMGVRAFS